MYTLIIFGASGDLTSRKLIPALYQLFRKNRLPKSIKIVGISRSSYTSETWREKLGESLKKFLPDDFRQDFWNAFSPSIFYFAADVTQAADFPKIETYLQTLEHHEKSQRVYYFATSPVLYENLGQQLAHTSCVTTQRLVIEKPFGVDLQTAQSLNDSLHAHFREDQIFRIDHYLGKETAQNLLVLRFANAIFEPLWNRNHISDIQITANEETLVGQRAAFYEKAGILRDMFQNHLLQLLSLTAMEPPARFEADAIRDEKVKVLRCIRPFHSPEEILKNSIRGQYLGYLSTANVAPDSKIATFGALRFTIDNWRWTGVPFYLRSTKGAGCQTTQIILNFRQPPLTLFQKNGTPDHSFQSNRLLIQIQPAEGIQIHFQTKVPDTEMKIRQTEFQFNFADRFPGEMPDAYQRLLLDALHGDASLFARSDEVENAWKIIDPIQKVWDAPSTPPPFPYPIGTWGPEESDLWIQRFSQKWFDACPVLSPNLP